MTWRVYALRDPRDNVIRYIGVTCFPLRLRAMGHRQDMKAGKTPVYEWMRSINGAFRIEEIEATNDGGRARTRESYWIIQGRLTGLPLLNVFPRVLRPWVADEFAKAGNSLPSGYKLNATMPIRDGWRKPALAP